MDCSVMIVDDSAILRRAMRRAVEQAGVASARIQEAGNGKEAIEALHKQAVDLILLDLNMPVMDGFQFMENRAIDPFIAQIPVVVVSTEGNERRLQALLRAGVKGRLHKPFEPEGLRAMVKEVLGR